MPVPSEMTAPKPTEDVSVGVKCEVKSLYNYDPKS